MGTPNNKPCCEECESDEEYCANCSTCFTCIGKEENRNIEHAKSIKDSHNELLKVTLAMREYIDALPDDIVLPAMPGFDRDWADASVDTAQKLSA